MTSWTPTSSSRAACSGVGNDPESLPAGGGLGSLPPQRPGRAWLIAQARVHRVDL